MKKNKKNENQKRNSCLFKYIITAIGIRITGYWYYAGYILITSG